LDHTKSSVEKIHSIHAEPAGHAHKLDMKLQSLCGNVFLCLLRTCLPNLTT